MHVRVSTLTGLVRWMQAGGGDRRVRLEGMRLGESLPGQNLVVPIRLMRTPWR